MVEHPSEDPAEVYSDDEKEPVLVRIFLLTIFAQKPIHPWMREMIIQIQRKEIK